MWMELQGKKAAHDFLLIYNKESRSPPLSGGFPLKTHDFLRSLEDGEAGGAEMPPSAEHVLPGGIGTYSITQVSVLPPSKLVRGTCAVVRADSTEGKPEPHNGHCAARSFPQWDGDTVAKDTGSTGRWPPPFAGCSGNNFGSPPSFKLHPVPEKKRFIMESAPIPIKPFPDVDDEDEEESQKVELSVKLDGKGNDQKQPSTPRSKHSATEQRRRSKINDRFQILRDLIPNSDQKRDKASFLLEVIEYIRFLQEKVQKYEAYPGWNQENAKLMPWNNQLPGDSMTDHSHFVKNVPPPGYMFSGKFDDNNIPVAPVMLSNIQNPTESDLSAGVPYKTMETPGFSSKEAAVSASMQTNVYASSVKAVDFTQPQQMLNSDTDSMGYQSQSQWLRSPCPPECTVSSATLNEQEELSINEGTISVSSAYSQGLLTALTQTLQSSGIDLSQASISVQIDLGKRAIHRHVATTTMSSAKDHDDPLFRNQAIGQLRVGNSREECEQAPKRHKLDNNS